MAYTMVIIVLGTLEEVNTGILFAQAKFFHSWWITFSSPYFDWKLPVAPGGATIGLLLSINLICSQIKFRKMLKKSPSLILIHLGLILLIIGELCVQWYAEESQLSLKIGEAKNYSENLKFAEIVLSKSINIEQSQESTINFEQIKKRQSIDLPQTPFSIKIHQVFPHTLFYKQSDKVQHPQRVNKGWGKNIYTVFAFPSQKDQTVNYPSVILSIHNKDEFLGTWLVSTACQELQEFEYQQQKYSIALRNKKTYFPFWMQLTKFTHEQHSQTDIPKIFASNIDIYNNEGNLQYSSLISMNEPLRDFNKVFYQASFAKNVETLSILQVVDNPWRFSPYISCTLIFLGLLLQFSHKITNNLLKKSKIHE
jgi:hypothetical protein